MSEPISDDDMRGVRDELASRNVANMWIKGGYVLQILTRLDAAESRAAELQREVERLNAVCKDFIGGEPPFDIEYPRG